MSAADHLQVPRQHGLFNHHGIDLGDGTIAHYLEGREILRSSFLKFSRGQQITIINHEKSSPKGVTLRRAMSRIGEQDYNLLFNNCEHFANWCKTGYHRSPQLENLFKEGKRRTSKLKDKIPERIVRKLDNVLNEFIAKDSNFEEKLTKLEKLKSTLRGKLNLVLNQIKEILNNQAETEYQENKIIRNLLLKGQLVEDELTALQGLESKFINNRYLKNKTISYLDNGKSNHGGEQ